MSWWWIAFFALEIANKVVTLELTQLPHYVASRAGAPVCFFVSNRAEPTNCERNLSTPVVVYYGWMGRVEETTFFVNSLAEKSQESACYAAVGYRIKLLGCLASEKYLTQAIFSIYIFEPLSE